MRIGPNNPLDTLNEVIEEEGIPLEDHIKKIDAVLPEVLEGVDNKFIEIINSTVTKKAKIAELNNWYRLIDRCMYYLTQRFKDQGNNLTVRKALHEEKLNCHLIIILIEGDHDREKILQLAFPNSKQ